MPELDETEDEAPEERLPAVPPANPEEEAEEPAAMPGATPACADRTADVPPRDDIATGATYAGAVTAPCCKVCDETFSSLPKVSRGTPNPAESLAKTKVLALANLEGVMGVELTATRPA